MKTFLTIFAAAWSLSLAAPAATISKADIIKTVEHLQERCHEAEAAQSATEAKLNAAETKLATALSSAAQLQTEIDVLAAHDKTETDRANREHDRAEAILADRNKLAARLNKLVLALAVAAGLLVWATVSKYGSTLYAAVPWGAAIPVVAGVAAGSAVFAWLRFIL
ncbi:MAG: hypothetical protein ACFUZC_16645 [Chthoniobacteraceae bacterium]